jgi:hypothetical protein
MAVYIVGQGLGPFSTTVLYTKKVGFLLLTNKQKSRNNF